MLFNSFSFVLFFPVVLAVTYSLPHKWKNRFLLAASIFFYASWDWRFLFPLLASTSIDYWCALGMERSILAGEDSRLRKPYLVFSLVTNLALLGFFKYFNFFTGSLADLLTHLGISANITTLEIVLPVGISFYTFQALSYTIDVYRGEIHSANSFADFLLAVLFFPHLVAGPIQRASSLLPQVTEPRPITLALWREGLHLMAWGFFKKVYIADNVAPLCDEIFRLPNPDAGQTLLACYAFALQIYCDFSGYTDIARGAANLLGFRFVLNFNLPYFATSPSEFWTRWHISLSSWLRDYLYIPLGGNRGSRWQTNRNLALTMILGGFWHGASWNFIFWGIYHGLLLILHRTISPWLDRFLDWGDSRLARAGSFLLRWVVMFHLTCYGWLLFRASSLDQIRNMTGSFFQSPVWHSDLAWRLLPFALPLIVVQSVQYATGKLDFLDWKWCPPEARAVVYAALLYFVLFRGGLPQSFIYFQF